MLMQKRLPIDFWRICDVNGWKIEFFVSTRTKGHSGLMTVNGSKVIILGRKLNYK